MPREKRPAASEGHEEGKRQTRKRERYTRVACESCKARKVKCSGTRPCGRCAELTVECKYHDHLPPADLTSDQKIRRLSEVSHKDLGQLLCTMKELCEEIELKTTTRLDCSPPALSSSSSPPSASLLQRRVPMNKSGDALFMNTAIAPTNFVRSLNLARDVLQQSGVLSNGTINPCQTSSSSSSSSSSSTGQQQSSSGATAERQPKETAKVTLDAARPILDLGLQRVMGNFATFEREIHTAYPCINLEYARGKTAALFVVPSPPSEAVLQDWDVDLIDVELSKAVMAIAMLVANDENDGDGGGARGSLSADLEGHLIWNIDSNMKQDSAQYEDVIMSSLLAIYFILKDQEVKAWRIAGYAAKACLELGMHKAWSHNASSDSLADVKTLKRLFSCVYDLDKRCSFSTGLPWTLDDKDIDDSVLDLDGRHPFLSAMNQLTRIHFELVGLNKATSPSAEPNSKERHERVEFLDYRVQKLSESFPKDEIFPGAASEDPELTGKRDVLEAVYRLRANQVRMFPHGRSLSSPEALAKDPHSARLLISLAVSSVELHDRISSAASGVVSRLWRSLIDLFLMGSVSCMFLAASYRPAEYGPLCRHAFHRGVDLLQRSPHQSRAVKEKLWCSLEDLRRIGESIQLYPPDATTPSSDFCGGGAGETLVAATAETLGVVQQQQQQQQQQRVTDDDLFANYEALHQDFLAGLVGDLDSSWQGQLEELGFMQQ